jgi:multicomponent Na+:H+ antiporter subunit A
MPGLTTLALIGPLMIGVAGAILLALLPIRRPAMAASLAALACLALYLPMLPVISAGGSLFAAFWGSTSLGIVGGFRLDGLSLIFALLITGIGALIFIYAHGYLSEDPRQKRLVVFLVIFMTAMLGAVTADDVILLFVFWELTSLASFFLVGYKHESLKARKAALQALLVTGSGGLALLAGLILVSIAAGTTSLSGILSAREAVLAHAAAAPAMLLIILGCFTKSAQVPFHFWLPNAMAAPTPVSAYLHSATMVKLGIYLLARLNPLYQNEVLWQGILTFFGVATAITGAVLAFRETDLKRVLAYTTVTALGTLTMLIGIAPALSITAAMTFLVVHAFYKAALFMVAGIIDHETGTRDAASLGGLRRHMPLTTVAALLAAFSMAGLPPFVGFVAKELIYEAKLELGQTAAFLILGSFLVNAATVAIACVLSWRLFFGEARGFTQAPHDPPKTMLAGPILLAILGLVAGGLPTAFGNALIDPAVTVVLGRPAEVTLKLWHGFNLVLALSAATMALGVLFYLSWERIVPRLRSLEAMDRYGPAVGYERLLAQVIAGAETVTTTIQHGSLRGYIRTLFLVIATACIGTLIIRGGFAWPRLEAPVDPRLGIALLIVVGAIAVMVARTSIQAVLAMGLVGFATALIFLSFGAPDVAFTQFAVETLLVVILATALMRLPLRRRDLRTGHEKTVDLAVALGGGLAVALMLAAVLASPFDPRLSLWFGAESVPSAHGRNVVNVILVDFRALDTLGEITVLAVAAFAVVALLRRTPETPEKASQSPNLAKSEGSR